MEELKTIETVDTSPFKHLVMTIGELPTSFVDSMTYYECLAWLVNYMQNTVIPAVNNNAEAVEELQTAFTTLKNYVDNYFDNLDVQTEINNKLDAMAEAGTLEELMADYLNTRAVFGFDTVSDLKNADNLTNGSFARTLGYYAKNDKGAALYKIRTITNDDVIDEKFILEMTNDNTLIAELIVTDTISPEQIGVKRDQTNDDAPYIQDCITYSKANGVKVTFGNNIYYVKSSLNMPEFYSIDFENITLQAIDTIAEGMINVKQAGNFHNGVLSNVILDQNNYAHIGIYVYRAYRRVYENILVKNTPADGYGILVDAPVGRTGGGNQFNFIRGDGSYVGCTFIYDKLSDNVYTHCDYRQYTVGLEMDKFVRVFDFHGYVANDEEVDWYTNSIFIKLNNNAKLLADELYPDTQNYIFHNSSTIPSTIGKIFYTHNMDTTQTSNAIMFYSTNAIEKDNLFYRWYVDSIDCDLASNTLFTLISPRKNDLNTPLTIHNITSGSDRTIEVPPQFVNMSMAATNYTKAGFYGDNLVITGTCPYGVTGSDRELVSLNIYSQHKIMDGYYPYKFSDGTNVYDGTILVSSNKVYITPNANQSPNFTYTVVIPAQKITQATS